MESLIAFAIPCKANFSGTLWAKLIFYHFWLKKILRSTFANLQKSTSCCNLCTKLTFYHFWLNKCSCLQIQNVSQMGSLQSNSGLCTWRTLDRPISPIFSSISLFPDPFVLIMSFYAVAWRQEYWTISDLSGMATVCPTRHQRTRESQCLPKTTVEDR